jgi:hypothetical protein
MLRRARRWFSVVLAVGLLISLGAQPVRAAVMQWEMAGISPSAGAMTGCDACPDKAAGARGMASCHLVCAPASALLPAIHVEIIGTALRPDEQAKRVSSGRVERPQPHPPKSAPLA